MKRLMATVLVLVMVFSFSAVAMAAASPTVPVVTVTEVPEETAKVLKEAVYTELKDKIADGEVLEEVLTFSCTDKKTVQIKADVKKGDKVVILYRDADGKFKVLNAKVVKDGVVQFRAVGKGDYMLVKIVAEAQADASKLIPKTGDSYRLVKLMAMGLAAIAIMTAAGVAIKRSNNAA